MSHYGDWVQRFAPADRRHAIHRDRATAYAAPIVSLWVAARQQRLGRFRLLAALLKEVVLIGVTDGRSGRRRRRRGASVLCGTTPDEHPGGRRCGSNRTTCAFAS